MHKFFLAAAAIAAVFSASAASAHEWRGEYHPEYRRECCRSNNVGAVVAGVIIGEMLAGSRVRETVPGYLPSNYYGRQPVPMFILDPTGQQIDPAAVAAGYFRCNPPNYGSNISHCIRAVQAPQQGLLER